MNVPDRLDSVRVPDDLPKITAKADAKVPNATTYTLMRECHTMGNLIRMCAPLPAAFPSRP
jgi:DNA-directed RNA polymerase II subunit RPB11